MAIDRDTWLLRTNVLWQGIVVSSSLEEEGTYEVCQMKGIYPFKAMSNCFHVKLQAGQVECIYEAFQ